jgi:hypothetical protein
MKKLFLFLLILLAGKAFAQKDTLGLHIPYANGELVYEKVFNVPGNTSKNLLFNNAQFWFLEHYNSLDCIQLKDSALSRIVAKSHESMTFSGPLNVALSCNDEFNVQIDCKNGKYRCRIFNIIIQYAEADGTKQYIKTNDMAAALLSGPNIAGFNNNQLKRAFSALNTTINNTMLLLNKTMADNNDF